MSEVSPTFVKINHLFSVGDKNTVFQNDRFDNPCARVRPLQGPKSPESGKEGFGVEKPPLPTTQEKGGLSQKIPISPQVTTEKMVIF